MTERIWAKIVRNHKVVRSIIHEVVDRVETYNFFDVMRAISEALKIPTPIVLDSYARNYIELGIMKFTARDFIEDIPFDSLVLERCE